MECRAAAVAGAIRRYREPGCTTCGRALTGIGTASERNSRERSGCSGLRRPARTGPTAAGRVASRFPTGFWVRDSGPDRRPGACESCPTGLEEPSRQECGASGAPAIDPPPIRRACDAGGCHAAVRARCQAREKPQASGRGRASDIASQPGSRAGGSAAIGGRAVAGALHRELRSARRERCPVRMEFRAVPGDLRAASGGLYCTCGYREIGGGAVRRAVSTGRRRRIPRSGGRAPPRVRSPNRVRTGSRHNLNQFFFRRRERRARGAGLHGRSPAGLSAAASGNARGRHRRFRFSHTAPRGRNRPSRQARRGRFRPAGWRHSRGTHSRPLRPSLESGRTARPESG